MCLTLGAAPVSLGGARAREYTAWPIPRVRRPRVVQPASRRHRHHHHNRLHPYIDPPRYEQHLEEVHGLAIRPKAGEIVAIPEHQMWMLTVKEQYRTKKGKVAAGGHGAARGARQTSLCAGGVVSLHSPGRQHQGAKPDASWPPPAAAAALRQQRGNNGRSDCSRRRNNGAVPLTTSYARSPAAPESDGRD